MDLPCAGGPWPGAEYLRAQPDGHVFLGGPEVEELDLVQVRPDNEVVYGGLQGIMIYPDGPEGPFHAFRDERALGRMEGLVIGGVSVSLWHQVVFPHAWRLLRRIGEAVFQRG